MSIFIRKPVVATVTCLLILIIGLVCLSQLSVRQFPALTITTITVNTTYPGANAKTVQSFVTEPLEEAIASADGIDHMTASSTQGQSTITVFVKLNYAPDKALTDITSKVNAVKYLLPNGVRDPSLMKQTGVTFPSLIVSFTSSDMSAQRISAYLAKVVRPQLQNIPGLAFINIFGNKPYAMRVWLNPVKMVAHNISANDIYTALANNNIQAAPGDLKGQLTDTPVSVSTDLNSPKQFENLVVKRNKNDLVRLGDVAKVTMGSENYDSDLVFNGKKAVNLAFILQPGANPITVINQVRKQLPSLATAFPPGLHSQVVYDSTKYIKQSLHEVVKTLIEAVIIVTLIVFLFLGSFRLVVIPAVSIPLSLIGVCSLLYMLNFSINTLTLLAMVLAIGLVVDDAIVVLENIHRYSEKTKDIISASIKGLQQVFIPLITMSLTLAVVFAPIGFIGGLTGALFKEFAFTLSLAVVVSGVVAIILTPMMCSKIIKPTAFNSQLYKKSSQLFDGVQNFYLQALKWALRKKYLILVLAVIALLSCGFFFLNTPKTLAPQEDQGYLGIAANGPSNASLNYLHINDHYLESTYKSLPGMDKYFIVNGPGGNVSSGVILKDESQRHLSQMALANILQNKLSSIPGLQAFVYQIPPLPMAGGGPPVQFVITSTLDHQKIYALAQEVAAKARQSGLFAFIIPTLKFDNSQLNIKVNREKAANLGVSMDQINQALSTLWSNNYVNFFSYHGYSYQVIPQALERFRNNENALQWIYVRTKNNQLIPLSSIASTDRSPQPASLDQFQQMNSVTLQGVLAKGVTLGQGLTRLQEIAKGTLPPQMSINFSGASRAFMQESGKIGYLVGFAIILIYLLLALQFESFSLPLIVLTSVPMSMFGALLVLYLGMATINIYTEIGLLTLIGLITKHGILLVDFALKAIQNGTSHLDAVIEAAKHRLRPILMTTFAMIFGVVPLIFAQGAGSNSRFDLGIVIFFGMLIGTIFTLFVVPTVLMQLLNLSKPRAKTN